MHRYIFRAQRVSRLVSRRCYSSEPQSNHEPPLQTKDESGDNTIFHTPNVEHESVKPRNEPEDKSGPGPFKRLTMDDHIDNVYPSYTRAPGQYFQPKTPSPSKVQQNEAPSFKRTNDGFSLDPTHGPPIRLRPNGVPPHFIRPLLDGGFSAQEMANQKLIDSAADLGEEIVHPKLGKGYRENYILLATDTFIPINFADRHDSIPRRWLRDNCRCAKCRRPDTMQREVNIFASNLTEIPKSINKAKKEGLEVTWLDSTSDDANSDHVTLYPWDWLWKHKIARNTDKAYTNKAIFVSVTPIWDEIKKEERALFKPDRHQHVLWDSRIALRPPIVKYDEVMASDTGVGEWTRLIHNFGFCFVDGVPVCPEKTQELLERIAFIRPTHYGGFYDFTSDLTMKDTAYTSEAIGPHTDTTYFTDPAGLQMFHLLSHTEGTGGESLLVDGFWASRFLRQNDKNILSKVNIPWHASGNDGINITPNKPYPVLTMDSNFKATQIRWNEADRGVIPPRDSEAWYQAAKIFDQKINEPKQQYWSQLVPGRALIFDNWRVLHGRSEFTGKRRICGGYINRDDYYSRYLNTNFTREEILERIL